MVDHSANNKRIAKNTMMLYVRMLFSMLVSLYTSRVILQTLGVEDYGIYNVVGGVVSMFSMISGSLSSAISRFMTFELGKGDKQKLKIVFSTSINIQVLISFIVVVLVEIVGVWFLNNKMVIPAERMVAANWIFQFSLVTFVVGLISVPYNAAIIAHERMKAFAYIGILEVLAKLGIVFSLMVAPIDKLIFYGLLLMLLSLVIRIVYGVYCKRNFEECTYSFVMDKPLLKEMFGFAGWNFIPNGVYVLNTQGVNMLINMFFGVAFNAARGIAEQVNSAVMSFVNSFTMAINPQITKQYASGQYESMFLLICRGSKFSFFIVLLIALPIVIELETLLSIWLTEVPPSTVMFIRLTILSSIIQMVGNSQYVAIQATGEIKLYTIVVTTIGFGVFPVTWICYKLGYSIECCYYLFIMLYFLIDITRIFFLKKLLNFPISLFISQVVYKIFIVLLLSSVIPMVVYYFFDKGLFRLILVILTSVVSVLASVLIVGLTNGERGKCLKLVKQKLLM
jgi:O-antigen/teichoic acid export membrane protein